MMDSRAFPWRGSTPPRHDTTTSHRDPKIPIPHRNHQQLTLSSISTHGSRGLALLSGSLPWPIPLTAPPPLTSLPRSSLDSVPFPSAPPMLLDTSGNRANANPSPPPPLRTQNPSYPLHPPTLTSPTSTSTRKLRSLPPSAQISTCSSTTR